MKRGESTVESVIDMKRFRRDLRLMWKRMRFKYLAGNKKFWEVPFPEKKYLGGLNRDERRDQD